MKNNKILFYWLLFNLYMIISACVFAQSPCTTGTKLSRQAIRTGWNTSYVPQTYLQCNTWQSFWNYVDDGTPVVFPTVFTATVNPTDTFFIKQGANMRKSLIGKQPVWFLNGNSVGAEKWIGTIDNFDLPIRANNSEVVRLTTSGRVGIGTTTPNEILQVNGNIRVSDSIKSNSNALSLCGGNSEMLNLDGGTGVGFLKGTTFKIASNSTNYNTLANISGNEFAIQPVTYFHLMLGYNYTSGNRKLNSDDDVMRITNNNTLFYPVLTDGKVGVGTSLPTATLETVSTGTTNATYSFRAQCGKGVQIDTRNDGYTFLTGLGITIDNWSDGNSISVVSDGSNVIDMNKANGERFQIRQNSNTLVFNAISGDRNFDFQSNGTSILFIDGASKRIQYVDGNEATGKILTSDASGVATWQNPLSSLSGWKDSTGVRAFGANYNPSSTHSTFVTASFSLSTALASQAKVEILVNGNIIQTVQSTTVALSLAQTVIQTVTFIVPKDVNYRFNNTDTGGGTSTIISVNELQL